MMEETYLLQHPGVKKKILHGGRGPLPHFPSGTKLVFHFQTLLDNFERTVVDDSRRNKTPTEIFVGKLFKLEIWEVLLTSMRIGEVAEFWCDALHTGLYPLVSKGMRLVAEGRDPLEGQKHMCGMGNVFTYHSTGYHDLDEMMREPQALIFIMELISVGEPYSYHRESWLMGKDEKMTLVPSLHLRGNSLVREQRYREASEEYKEAVLLLRTVQSREMPGHEDYIKLSKLIIPLVLNYCQCMLELEEYYEVIEHTSELIDKHKDCVKAYYKRAKAYTAVWSEREARRDFLMVANLDVTLARLVQKELRLLSERMKEKYWEDKETYWRILEEKECVSDKQSKQNQGSECLGQEVGEEQKCWQTEGVGDDSHSRSDSIRDLDRQQMLRLVLLLQDEGSFYIKEQHFAEAMVKFKKALEYVDHIQTEVNYKGEDWESLEKVRVPLTLNLSQCSLELGEYKEVIRLNNRLLKNHADNLKAIYQRARAHAALYHEQKARQDFSRVESLDPQLKPIINQELKKLAENLRVKHVQEKKNYWTSSQEKWQLGEESRMKITGKVGKTGEEEDKASVRAEGSKEKQERDIMTEERESFQKEVSQLEHCPVEKGEYPTSQIRGFSPAGTQGADSSHESQGAELNTAEENEQPGLVPRTKTLAQSGKDLKLKTGKQITKHTSNCSQKNGSHCKSNKSKNAKRKPKMKK